MDVHWPVDEVEVEIVGVERFQGDVKAFLDIIMICAPTTFSSVPINTLEN